ncbi:MAG: DUF1501 domain-containing protein [Planctomycetaceae bacterium]
MSSHNLMYNSYSISRRDCLQAGLLGGVGLTLSDYFELAASPNNQNRKASADAVLFVNLAGGPSHLDTLDMKPEAPAETRGEFKPIASRQPGLSVCEHLPNFANIANQFTLLRGISHSAGAHPQGQSWISTGNRPTPALIYPSFGSVVTKERPTFPDIPPYVAIPKTEWNAGYMGDAYAPFKTNSVPKPGKPFQVRGISLANGLTLDKVNRREQLLRKVDHRFRDAETNSQLLEALNKFGRQAYKMITSDRARAAFDVEKEPESIRKQFGPDEFSQSLLLGCRLIQSGVRFVTVTNQGWDTHLDNFAGHKRLLGPFDIGIPAMMHMLNAKGLLKRTLVIVMGEFGRTPKINANAGRDHYPRVNWCLMAGGGVKPGQLIGSTNKAGTAPSDGTDITPDDLAATLYHSLGIDPRTEYHTRTGRPAMLVPEGRVIKKLFA